MNKINIINIFQSKAVFHKKFDWFSIKNVKNEKFCVFKI